MKFWLVNGVEVKTPSKFEITYQDISASDAGRTDDTMMHKNRVGQKVSIALSWNAPSPEEAAEILTAFDPEYFEITYPDAKTNALQKRTFYAGDRSAPMKCWFVGGKRYSQLSFTVIER